MIEGRYVILQSIILKSIKNLTGTVSYRVTHEGVYIQWDAVADEDEDVVVSLVSFRKPGNLPVIASEIRFLKGNNSGSCTVSEDDLILNGYSASDADTFVFSSKTSYRVLAVGYGGFLWDVGYKIKEIMRKKDYSLVRGNQILKSIKKPPADIYGYQKVILQIENSERSLAPAEISPVKKYRWYSIKGENLPVHMSAYKHLLSDEKAKNTLMQSGELLFGIGNNGRTALALKSPDNPFVTAEDCACKTGEYFVVGVRFAPDGQYFEKIPPTD